VPALKIKREILALKINGEILEIELAATAAMNAAATAATANPPRLWSGRIASK
jgi:hypothetical protein